MSEIHACRAAKLRPPKYLFKAVSTKAFRILTEGYPRPKIATVVAPPGYGKTVLLAQLFHYLTNQDEYCLWIGLEDGDADLTRLLGLLESELGIEQPSPPVAMDYSRQNSTAECINRIIAKLSGSGDVVIFIDNVDFCRSGEIARLLNALAFNTPDTVGLVFSSSEAIPFDATRALLELRLRAIGPAELGFDLSNIEILFQEAGVAHVSHDMAAAILDQSEGWPAAVRLMQVIRTTDPAANSYAGRFSQDNTHLTDILSRRLMSRLEPELVEFLRNVAEFNHFSAEMVDVATGCTNANRCIRYLLDNNVLIIPLDERQTWFRFHTLFRQFLISQSNEQVAPERRRSILLRGAEWLEERGHTIQGLDLAVRAGERKMASRMLEKLAWDLVRNQGELPSFITWVGQARSIDATLGGEASFWYVWALIFERRYEVAKTALSDLDTLIGNANFSPARTRNLSAKAGLAEIVLKLHLDSLAAIHERASAWLDAHSDAEPFEVAAVAGAMAIVLLANQQFADARKAIRQSQSAVASTTSLYGRAWVANLAAQAEIANGNPGEAEESLLEIERRIHSEMDDGALIAAVTAQVHARALFARGQIDRAKKIVEKSLPRMRMNGILDFTWMGMEVILPFSLRGESPITLGFLRSIAKEQPRRLSILLELNVIRLLTNFGQTEEALERAVDLGVWSPAGIFTCLDDAQTPMERSAARMAEIGLLTACGQFKNAEELIQNELLMAQKIGRRGAEVDLYLAQSGVFIKSNQWRLALRAFAKAIGVAADRRLLQPFYEQGNLVGHIMANAKIKELGIATVSGNALIGEISRMLGCRRPATSSLDAPTDGPMPTIGAPTPRELELLSMIERGLDNAQIAEALSLSVRTVKWHLANLYAKFDVKNRTSALAKARSLHLL